MMRIGLVTIEGVDEAPWTEAVATVLGDLADFQIVRLDGSRLSAASLDQSAVLVVTACDDAVLRRIEPLHGNIVIVPPPSAVDRLKAVARTGEARLRVLALTAACHAAAQRAGLRSAYFQYFPDPASCAARQASGGPPSIYSFLDGMARGDVVVEPGPVGSDYIVDGINGFTHSPECSSLTEQSHRISAAARLTVAQGFARWCPDRERLSAYLGSLSAGGAAFRFARTIPVPTSRRFGSHIPPVVTIATVVRNAAAEVRPTLHSICGQRYPAYEVVVFDGGSTDGTLDVIREFATHIDHVTSEPDKGPYDAMQKAATAARGRRILFMNAGDRFVDEGALGRLMEAAADAADVVAGHHVYIDGNGVESVNHCVDFRTTYARLLAGDLDSAWIRGAPCHQAVLTRTDLIRQHGFDLSYRIAADHEFMYRMHRQGASFQVVPTIVAEYVGGGLSARQEFRCLEEWRRIAHTYSHHRRRADRSLDRLLFMAMKAQRRRGPFDFSEEPARSRPLIAASIGIRHRIKSLFQKPTRPQR